MNKKITRLNEADIRRIVRGSVNKIIKETAAHREKQKPVNEVAGLHGYRGTSPEGFKAAAEDWKKVALEHFKRALEAADETSIPQFQKALQALKNGARFYQGAKDMY